jgi:hypothetical protein
MKQIQDILIDISNTRVSYTTSSGSLMFAVIYNAIIFLDYNKKKYSTPTHNVACIAALSLL